MKFVFFGFIIIMRFLGGESQLWQNMSFLQNDLMNFFFPKDPNLMKVRKLEKIREATSDAVVLDFVSIIKSYLTKNFLINYLILILLNRRLLIIFVL